MAFFVFVDVLVLLSYNSFFSLIFSERSNNEDLEVGVDDVDDVDDVNAADAKTEQVAILVLPRIFLSFCNAYDFTGTQFQSMTR